MRVLTKLENNEFELTFSFISHYVGMAHYHGAKSPYDISFNGYKLPSELLAFIQSNFDSNLKKINELFNEHTLEHKEKMIDRLIKYCFANRIQPSKLRLRNTSGYEITKEHTLFTEVEFVA